MPRKNIRRPVEQIKGYYRFSRDKAKLPSYEQKLSSTEIKSPADGIITNFSILFAVLKEGDVIAEIVLTENALTVKGQIDAEDIASIEPAGQKYH